MSEKLKEFDIIFCNPRKTYKAGDTVSGYLILHLDQEIATHGLRLIFSGRAYVMLIQHATRKRLQHQCVKERYFETDVNIYPPNGIPVGHHEFPFTYSVPAQVPSSFEGLCGHVRYSVKAKLKVSWDKFIKVKRYFIVFHPLDLSDTRSARNARLPVENSRETPVWGALGKIKAHLSLRKRGFVPGEEMTVRAVVKNGTGFRVTKVFFTLEQTDEFYSFEKTETYTQILTTGTPPQGHGTVPARSSAVWDALNVMSVPVTTPSRLDGCQSITVSHHLALNLVLAGVFTIKKAAKVDILIGTKPVTSQEHTVNIASAPTVSDPAYFSNEGYLPHPDDYGDREVTDDTGLPSYSVFVASQEVLHDGGAADHNTTEMREELQQPPAAPPAYEACQEQTQM